MTLRFLALTALAALAPVAARAQPASVRGRVTDAAGAPLPGVNVYVEGRGQGAVTNADGTYALGGIAPGPARLVASSIGYERAVQPLDAAPGGAYERHFTLAETTLQSGEVVVTASRRAQVAGSAPVSLSVLTPQDLESRNIVTLDGALRQIHGVQVAGNQINIRGASGFSYNVGSRVLLLVDGAPMLSPESGGVPLDAVPLSRIEQIEVVRGPGSALYGAGALGGVVNLITRAYPARPETELTLFGGAHEPARYPAWRKAWPGGDRFRGLGGASAAHARRLGRAGGFWAATSLRNDAGYMDYNQRRTWQSLGKLGWAPGPGLRLALLGGYTWSQYDSFFYWNGINDALSPGRLDLVRSGARGANDLRSTLLSVFPTATLLPSPRLSLAARGRFYRARYMPLDDSGAVRSRDKFTTGYRAGAELQADWQAAPGRHLTLGVSADGMAARSEFFSGQGGGLARGQPEGAAFAQWDEQLSRRLSLVAGLRFDAYQIDQAEAAARLSPKLAAAYRLTERFTARASFGQGFRIPSIAERFTNNQEFFPILPNLKLRPEESTGFEVGGRYGGALGRGLALELDLAGFHNTYRNLVEPRFLAQGGAAGFRFENLSDARVAGLEASVELAAGAGARHALQAGYTLLDARDRTLDAPLALRPRHQFKASARTRAVGALELGADVRLASRPERVDTDFARFVPDADVMLPVRVVDARIGLARPAWSLFLNAENVFDYYYMERPALLAPPRQYRISLTTRF